MCWYCKLQLFQAAKEITVLHEINLKKDSTWDALPWNWQPYSAMVTENLKVLNAQYLLMNISQPSQRKVPAPKFQITRPVAN